MPEISPDFFNRLQDFGFAAMAAGAQPGANTFGALGQAGMTMNENAQQRALKNAQMEAFGQDMLSKQLENASAVRGFNARNRAMGMDEYIPSQLPQALVGRNKPASSGAGMTWSSVAGSDYTAPSTPPAQDGMADPSGGEPRVDLSDNNMLRLESAGFANPSEARAYMQWPGASKAGAEEAKKYLDTMYYGPQEAKLKAEATLPYDLQKAQAGSTRVLNNIQAYAPFNEKLQGQMAENLVKDYETLQTVPETLLSIRQAKGLISKSYTGGAAGVKQDVSKLWNGTIGGILNVPIDPTRVSDTDYLRSTLGRQIVDSLKKMDSNPSENQQKKLEEYLGNINTDPKALGNALDLTEKILAQRVRRHNSHVDEARDGGATFGYNIKVDLPGANGGGGKGKNAGPALDMNDPRVTDALKEGWSKQEIQQYLGGQ